MAAWDIVHLPDDEYQDVVRQRLEEYHRRCEAEGMRVNRRGRGRHNNDLPGFAPGLRSDRGYVRREWEDAI